ncbi:hypothetical protein [Zestomonas carbonaria]|uniref:hypothetical protein n=1 Tax=Zestomonas carbonaria TaxID=2762745 RepID=UPI0016576464|nr:hypothetical protein [Pseudomonas carbonaria]
MFDYICTKADVISALANSVMALMAVLAGAYAWWQVKANREAQQEATAKGIYSNYLHLAFKYPEFSNGIDLRMLSDEDNNQKDLIKKYKWFVSIMLTSCEEIWMLVLNDDLWKASLKTQIGYHANFLKKMNGGKAFIIRIL